MLQKTGPNSIYVFFCSILGRYGRHLLKCHGIGKFESSNLQIKKNDSRFYNLVRTF